MKKILITGANGMLGKTLTSELSSYELVLTDKEDCDITNYNSLDAFVSNVKPDIIIHTAAMTAVDDAETNIDLAYSINAIGSLNVAKVSKKHNARLIAISTDYVFDGLSDIPYNEYDIPNPQNIYGKSKYAGEQAIMQNNDNYVIARTSWLYGEHGNNFVDTMLKLADGTRAVLNVVHDQVGNPTSTYALAQGIKQILLHDNITGVFHLTCEGEASWCEFAKEIFKMKGITQRVNECTSDEFPRPAKRPKNSRLDKMNLRLHGLDKMMTWQEALKKYLLKPQ